MHWWTEAQYRLLRAIAPGEPTHMTGEIYRNRSKLEILLGKTILERLRGKVVLDSGAARANAPWTWPSAERRA